MLGRGERESAVHTRMAARAAKWDTGEDDLLVLGSTSSLLGAVANIDDLSAVVHIGHPAQPVQKLEHTLLNGPASLLITAAVSIEQTWQLVAAESGPRSTALLDEVALRDCRSALDVLGITPHLVPQTMPVAERIALAGTDKAIVLEAECVPPGYITLATAEELGAGTPLWYGLCESGSGIPQFQGPHQVWLALGPRTDSRGSLRDTLDLVATAGIDLQHIRSASATEGPHVFFLSFECDNSQTLQQLHDGLDAANVRHRVLAAISAPQSGDGPHQVTPLWP